jgi:hypothetical protein
MFGNEDVGLLGLKKEDSSKNTTLIIIGIITSIFFFFLVVGLVCLVILISIMNPTPKPTSEELKIFIDGDDFYNHFYGNKETNVHVVVSKNTTNPRLIYALPAGNEAFLILFESEVKTKFIFNNKTFLPIKNGVENEMIIMNDLKIKAILMGRFEEMNLIIFSARTVRHYIQTNQLLFPEMKNQIQIPNKKELIFQRIQLNGKDEMKIKFQVYSNLEILKRGEDYYFERINKLESGSFKISISTTKKTLNRISRRELLKNPMDQQREAELGLSFLSYKEKLLAGSWRFNTYFGRDTLMSLEMLMPILTANVIESSLESVLTKVNNEGSVAHEEEIDDFSDWIHKMNNRTNMYGVPIYDYKMIDDDYMLLPVLKNYLFNFVESKENAQIFFQRNKNFISKNIQFILKNTRPFYQNPIISNLIHIKHQTVGNWRDSSNGLGYEKIPYGKFI